MSQDVITTKDGMKLRKLTELKPTTAKEYQEAILHRVEHFSKRKDSVFNDFVENTIVQGLKFLLEAKVQLDKVLGDNMDNVQKTIEKILLTGL